MATTGTAAPVMRRVHAYFAPVARTTSTPSVFDPSLNGGFSLDAPPAPWISLGWIENFRRKSGTKIVPLMTGAPAAPLEQVREQLDAEVSFDFLSWSKLTMALATSSQHMNLLAAPATSASADDGASATTAVALGSASTATFLALAASDAARFSVGEMVAVDVDNSGATGFVGSPVSGAYLKSVVSDVNYVRRVTFNVAEIASVNSTGLTLSAALPGGVPASGMKVQGMTGFVDREGGSFFQEWSALFVMQGAQGERIFFYYPRLQAMAAAAESMAALDAGSGTLERVLLSAHCRALPVVDSLDGERVLCYRSYLP